MPPVPALETSTTFSWTSGSVHLDVLLGLALLGVVYAWGWTRRPGKPSARRIGCFFAGLVSLALALNGPLHDLSEDVLFSAHMVQHLILILTVPPLLLAGTPAWMIDRLLDPLLARRATRSLVTRATHPLSALALYGVALVVWHLPGPYGATLAAHGWHIVQHLTLLAAAVLAWWPVLSPSARVPRLPYGAQILYLFLFGMPMTVVAAMVTGAETLLYPYAANRPLLFGLSPLADQRLGGVLMWVPAGLVPLISFTVVFFRWAATERDD